MRTAKASLFLAGGWGTAGRCSDLRIRVSSRCFLWLSFRNSSRRLNFIGLPFDVWKDAQEYTFINHLSLFKKSGGGKSPYNKLALTFLLSSKASLAWVALIAWYDFLFFSKYSGTNCINFLDLKTKDWETCRLKQSIVFSVSKLSPNEHAARANPNSTNRCQLHVHNIYT